MSEKEFIPSERVKSSVVNGVRTFKIKNAATTIKDNAPANFRKEILLARVAKFFIKILIQARLKKGFIAAGIKEYNTKTCRVSISRHFLLGGIAA
jgi:hypothetical protein